jgi:hypothetical protein
MWSTIRHEALSLDTGQKALRSFGLVMAGAAGLIALFVFWRSGWATGAAVQVLLGMAALFALLGMAWPRVLLRPYRVWMVGALVLGFVMTRVILSVVFFLVLTPIGLIMHLLGKNPLARRPDAALATYWIPKEPQDGERERLERYG